MATMVMGQSGVDAMEVRAALAAGARGWGSRDAAKNRVKFEQQLARRRGPTPEMFFTKHIDNTRLEKKDNEDRKAEIKRFTVVVVCFFALVFVYLLQHFWAIKVGMDVEAQKITVERLREENRQLRLADAVLSDPQRLDALAGQLGMGVPAPGQVVRQEGGEPVVAEVQKQGVGNRE